MLQIRSGDRVYSRRHKCILECLGRNGGRPHELCGHVVRNGEADTDTWKIFEAADVESIQGQDGMQVVLPGVIAATYNPSSLPTSGNRWPESE